MYSYDESIIGNNIKRIRKEKGLSQRDLSAASGLQNTVISAFENSKKTPGLVTLIKIAKAMDVSLDELVFGTAADRAIGSDKDDAEVITRCIYELWKRKMLFSLSDELFDDYGDPREMERYQNGVYQFEYPLSADRLIGQLNDFSENRDTYSKPDEHLLQILESSTNELKNLMRDNGKYR